MPQIAAYGSWLSPVTSASIVAEAVGLGQVRLDGDDLYWLEQRPGEAGRGVIVCRDRNGQSRDVTPPPFNVRTRVHEYGGGAYCVADGVVYFSNDADQRLYRQRPGAAPQPLTRAGGFRYADAIVDAVRRRLICVREDHSRPDHEPVNTLAGIALDGDDAGHPLVHGADFYAAPGLSPDGSRLAWLSWSHPAMPWDGTELWTAAVRPDGSLEPPVRVAGGPDESIFQPQWSPDGILHFVSDRTGWWNLYRWRGGSVEPLLPMAAEFGLPQWVFGLSTYGFDSTERLVVAYTQRGRWRLATLDTAQRRLTSIELPYTEIGDVRVAPGRAVFTAGAPAAATAIVELSLPAAQTRVLRRSQEQAIDPGYLSAPQPLEYPTADGATAHALFYPPANRDYAAPAGERPPLIVRGHGGPTSAASSTLDLRTQFWTSRGFAVLDVDYRGSTGYGRAYRQSLHGRWGSADVADCIHGARYLAERGIVDGNRLIIRGSSAGGYTTLCALTFHDTFRAGASYYGISDLEALTRDTHKFESRYLERLIGPYPQRADLYRERSPIHYADRLSCPVIFFQGMEDKVVPPAQTERMVQALRDRAVPVAFVAFPGEQHGFRRADSIKRALEAELLFYARVFGIRLPERLAPIVIEHLPDRADAGS